MKNEKGITLIVLIVTILLMVIIAGIAVSYGTSSLESVRFQNFSFELQQIQGKVDTIYEKIKLANEEEKANYITLGENVTESSEAVETLKTVKRINYSNSNMSSSDREKYYYEDGVTYYRYLSEEDLKNELDITSNPGDVIINFQTREVISVNGFEFEGKVYYRLSDIK